MAAQFPSLAAFPAGIGGSPFPSNQHILNQQQAITANGPSSTSSFQPSSFLMNNFQSSIASSVPSSSLSPFMMPSPFSSIPHNNNQPPPMVSIGNSSSSAPFNGFMRPSSSSRPIAQLRRASSASMEAAGKYGNNGTSRAAQQNGFGGGGAFGGGGNRPASLQHHELLLYNNGADGQPQSQRTTPLPRKFDSMEQMALVLEEERSAAQQEEEEEEEEMMKSSPNRRREKTGDELMEQPISIGQNHHPHHHHSLPPPSLPLLPPPSSHPHSSHPPASAPLAVAPSLRRNSSLTSNFSSGSSKGPHSALPSGIGPYPMFSPNPLPSTAAPPLQSTCGSNANNVDSNVTLWQFLLELLAANDHPNLIQWTNNEGEFKLHDAEAVARLWGIRKGKPNMNYDKLSRALRYYYDKNIIKKVIGQKFVYRFVMDNKQAGGIAECAGAPGNPELVKYAMTKAGLNVNNGNANANGIAQPSRGQMEAARFGHSSSFHPICSTASENFPPSRVTESSKSIGNSLNTLNPNGCGAQSSRNANVATLTPSPATSSCSPTGSVESSSGVSSGSGISGFAVPNGLNGTLGHLMGLGQIKQEPGLSLPSAHHLHNSVATTSSACPYNPVERARTTRKRKSPSEMQQARMEGAGEEAPYMGMLNGRGGGGQQIQQDDASAPKIGCSANTAGPSLSRRARPQPLDLTTVNNSSSAMSNLTGQMSQMVAASPLLLALQQHNLQQQQQQQQSPLLSAAINALSNYAASPMASVASPLAQAAAFQLASNLVASLSPNINSSNQNANNSSGINNAGLINYPLANNGATMAHTTAAGSSGNPLNVATTSSLYSQLHSALTTPIAANQVKTPQQHFSNSAMISAVINHLANGPNTPFAQQQQQQQMQQQPSLFQFPPTSNMAIAHTLAMLSSPGLPLAGQSPFPFMSQMAALQTPKMPNFPSGFNQRSPDSLKTPMGGLNFEFGQVLAAAAANKK